MNNEEWRPIAEAPGYDVSDLGNVRSWRSRHGLLNEPHARALFRRDDGYMIITLTVDGRRFSRPVHAFVARAFLGPCPEGQQVRHLDGRPGNNALPNLRYGTPAENGADKVRHGTSRSIPTGEAHPKAKLTDAQVTSIRRERLEGITLQALADRYNVCKSHVSNICQGKRRAT